MSDKTEAGCWLVDLWRQTKTTSSIISPKSHRAWTEYVTGINVTVDGKPHRPDSQQWNRMTVSDNEYHTIAHQRPSSDPNGVREEWDPDE